MPKKNKKLRVKPKAVCVFRWDDRIFVARGYDHTTNETFYRPIGGTIEFGERGEETIQREVMEEISVAVADVIFIGLLENIFTFEGKRGHELMLIYDARFVDVRLYDQSLIVRGEDDGEHLFDAMWKPLTFFRGVDAPPLYPDGLLTLLDKYR